MNNSSNKTWFLLGYLVLLLNLGPSVHHVGWFGLHCQNPKCCQTSNDNVRSSCCCCEAHGVEGDFGQPRSGEPVEAGLSPLVADTTNGCGSSCEDCVFCDFFDQFNVVDVRFRFILFESPHWTLPTETPSAVFGEPVAHQARGPPAIY